jgi:oxidoreductase
VAVTQPLRVVVVGAAGRRGAKYVSAARSDPSFTFTAGVDVRAPTAPEAVLVWAPSVAATLRRVDADVVVVAVPPAAQPKACLAALEHGRSVLCEKPGGVRLADVELLLVAAERQGRLLTFARSLCVDPVLLMARDHVRAGTIGRLLQVDLLWTRRRRLPGAQRPAGMPWPSWMLQRDAGGGVIRDLAFHLLDVLFMLLPEGDELDIVGATRDGRLLRQMAAVHGLSADAEDTVAMVARSGSDVVASLRASWMLEHSDREPLVVTCHGTKGSLKILGDRGKAGLTLEVRTNGNVPVPGPQPRRHDPSHRESTLLLLHRHRRAMHEGAVAPDRAHVLRIARAIAQLDAAADATPSVRVAEDVR